MSSSKFVSNLNGMNEGGNFSKDLLKVKIFPFLKHFKEESEILKTYMYFFISHTHYRVFTIP